MLLRVAVLANHKEGHMTSKCTNDCPTPEQLCALVDALDSPHGEVPVDPVVRERCAACAACGHELGQLRQVRQALRTVGQDCPAPPAHLVAQITARLDEPTTASVLPLHPKPSRRPYLAMASGAACAVAIGGWALSTQLSSPQGPRTSASGPSQSSVATDPAQPAFSDMSRVQSTNANFTKASFQEQIAALVPEKEAQAPTAKAYGAGNVAPAAEKTTSFTTNPTSVAKDTNSILGTAEIEPTLKHLFTSSGLGKCIGQIGVSPENVFRVALGAWEGKPAAVVLMTTDSGYNAWVVSAACGAQDTDQTKVLHYQKYVT